LPQGFSESKPSNLQKIRHMKKTQPPSHLTHNQQQPQQGHHAAVGLMTEEKAVTSPLGEFSYVSTAVKRKRRS